MIGGINDTDLDADAMAELLRGDLAHVNLIPMNPVAHTPWSGAPMPRHRALRRNAPRGRHRDDDPPQPGQGDRRRLRPARRRACRPADPASSSAGASGWSRESAAALRGERSDEPAPAGIGEE